MQNYRLHSVIIGALAAWAPCVFGDIYTSTEGAGGTSNVSIATAEMVPGSRFTPNANPNVFGSMPTATVQGSGGKSGSNAYYDVDFFGFSAGVGPAWFDVDQNPLEFDSTLALFDSNGTLLAWGELSIPVDPGSGHPRDPFIGTYNIASPGTYYVAISGASNYPKQYASGGQLELTRPDGVGGAGGDATPNADFGDSTYVNGTNAEDADLPYDLHISVSPIPAPGAALLAILGMPMVGWVRRRLS